MKTFKQIAALLLTVCLLVGMPLAVQANETSDEFKIIGVEDAGNAYASKEHNVKGAIIVSFNNKPSDAALTNVTGNSVMYARIEAHGFDQTTGKAKIDAFTVTYAGPYAGKENAYVFTLPRTLDEMKLTTGTYGYGVYRFDFVLYEKTADGTNEIECFNDVNGNKLTKNGTYGSSDAHRYQDITDSLKIEKVIKLPDAMAADPAKNGTFLLYFNREIEYDDTFENVSIMCQPILASGTGVQDWPTLVKVDALTKGNVLALKFANAARHFAYYEGGTFGEIGYYQIFLVEKNTTGNKYIDYIAAKDSGVKLYGANSTATEDRYFTTGMTHPETIVLPLETVSVHDFYQATLTFSQGVTINDMANVSLVDGDKTFVAKEIVSGNGTTAITIAFDNGTEFSALSDGAGIRITDSLENLMLEGSVTVTGNTKPVMHDETAVIVASANTSVGAVAFVNDIMYNSLEDALDAAVENDIVKLNQDVDYGNEVLMVPAGVQLNLNGQKLTTKYIMSFGDIVDSTDGKGGIIISNNKALAGIYLQEDNEMLPLYDDSLMGYRFFRYSVTSAGTKNGTATSVKFGIKVVFDNPLAYDLLATESDAALIMQIDLGGASFMYKFSQTTLQKLAAAVSGDNFENRDNKAIVLTVYGLTDGAVLTATPTLSSGRNVAMTGSTMTYSYPAEG